MLALSLLVHGAALAGCAAAVNPFEGAPDGCPADPAASVGEGCRRNGQWCPACAHRACGACVPVECVGGVWREVTPACDAGATDDAAEAGPAADARPSMRWSTARFEWGSFTRETPREGPRVSVFGDGTVRVWLRVGRDEMRGDIDHDGNGSASPSRAPDRTLRLPTERVDALFDAAARLGSRTDSGRWGATNTDLPGEVFVHFLPAETCTADRMLCGATWASCPPRFEPCLREWTVLDGLRGTRPPDVQALCDWFAANTPADLVDPHPATYCRP